jgi:uncharacterized protein (TIGR02001 family)
MKLKTLSALVLAASTMAMTSTAMAWESEDGQHSVSANVLLGSDYVFRGISNTDNNPTIQGGLDYGHSSGFYVGTWASNVDFDDPDFSTEFNIYGGYAGEFGDTGIGFDIGALRYIYPGVDGDADFNELYAGLSYSFFSFGIAHSSDFLATSEDGTYYNLGFEYGLPYDVTFAAGIGYQDMDDSIGEGYTDYLISLSKTFADLDFAVTWTDTDSDGEDFAGDDDLVDNLFTFSVSKTF